MGVGGAPQDAIDNTMAMTHITIGRNEAFTLPPMNFAGSPAGIDIRKIGSGNIGATNVLRTGKKAAAALTLLGDAAKGWVAMALALRFGEVSVGRE